MCEWINILRVRRPGVGQTDFENVETHENPAWRAYYYFELAPRQHLTASGAYIWCRALVCMCSNGEHSLSSSFVSK
mgnify:FL=1